MNFNIVSFLRNCFTITILFFCTNGYSQNCKSDGRVYYILNTWQGDYFGTKLPYTDLSIVKITDSIIYYSVLTDYESPNFSIYLDITKPELSINEYYKYFKPEDSIWVKNNPFSQFRYLYELDSFTNIEYYHLLNIDSLKKNRFDTISFELFISNHQLFWSIINSKPILEKETSTIERVYIFKEYKSKIRKKKNRC